MIQVISWDDFLKKNPWENQKTSVTIGVFDGIHPGHQQLIKRLTSDEELTPIVFTFKVNPAMLTRPKTFKGNILTLEQKIERVEKFGVKGAVIIDFSSDFSKLTGRNFFSHIGSKTKLSQVVLGENHRLGHKGETGADDARIFLQKKGIKVFIEDSILQNESPLSSTRVRNAIIEGHLNRVPELLGFEHILDFRGLPHIFEAGIVKIERKRCHQVLPPDGIYEGIIFNHQELFATKIILDKEQILWEQPIDVPVERITIRNYE
ncbi:MAG: FAD synthetase family protein [Spirochaetales bacterium]|nr:FAD synthetase family protein [Spirochaetales bacterium]